MFRKKDGFDLRSQEQIQESTMDKTPLVAGLLGVVVGAALGVAGYENLLANVSPLIVLVQVPITGAVTAYIFGLIAILVYNFVAQKYPISWDLKK